LAAPGPDTKASRVARFPHLPTAGRYGAPGFGCRAACAPDDTLKSTTRSFAALRMTERKQPQILPLRDAKRQDDNPFSVLRGELPTQAKTGLEWAPRKGHLAVFVQGAVPPQALGSWAVGVRWMTASSKHWESPGSMTTTGLPAIWSQGLRRTWRVAVGTL